MRLTTFAIAIATLVAAAGLDAQSGGRCPLIIIDGVVQNSSSSPGAAFGVTSYQCASCSIKQEMDAPSEYSFNAEPVVLQVDSWSVLRAGDVIEAVNGHPITTRAGADQFTHPPLTESVLLIRRGGVRIEIKTAAREQCENDAFPDPSKIQRVSVFKGAAAIDRYGVEAVNGAIVVETNKDTTSQPRRERERVRTVRPDAPAGESASESPTAGRYGFAISCLPSCTRSRARDGTDYWKFDGHPPVAGIRPGGAAAMAGLRVGDVVTDIDGISILTEEGALRFQRAEPKESIHVTVRRDGRKVGYLLQPR